MPLPPGRCALVDTLRPFDTPGAGDERLGISASRIALGDARPACPGGVGAQLDIWVEELDPARDFALLALDPSGSVRALVAGRDDFRKRSQQDAKAYYTDGNGRFHVAACFASTGTAGVLLVDRRWGSGPASPRATQAWPNSLARARPRRGGASGPNGPRWRPRYRARPAQ
jgi:serine/threonine-protein kinase